MIQINWLDMDV